VLALIGLATTGCRLDLTAAADLDRDGTGTASLAVRMDDALLDELDALAIDPTIEVTAAASKSDAWTLERTVDDQQAITILLTTTFDDPAQIGAAFRDLSSGLSDRDPGLFVDVEVAQTEDGGSTIDGSVGFRAPESAGVVVDGEPLGPSAAELEELTSRAVVPRLQLTMPGPVVTHDADDVAGRTVTWDIPIGGSRTVSAVAQDPAIYQQPWIWFVAAGLIAVIGAALLTLRRRRRRRVAPGNPGRGEARGVSPVV
jgi:LPXTG-motif cell wall-anchored protein